MQYNVGESTFELGEVEFKLFIFENVKIEDSPTYENSFFDFKHRKAIERLIKNTQSQIRNNQI